MTPVLAKMIVYASFPDQIYCLLLTDWHGNLLDRKGEVEFLSLRQFAPNSHDHGIKAEELCFKEAVVNKIPVSCPSFDQASPRDCGRESPRDSSSVPDVEV